MNKKIIRNNKRIIRKEGLNVKHCPRLLRCLKIIMEQITVLQEIHNGIDLSMNSMILKNPNQLLDIKCLFFKIGYIYFKINILQF